jgi:hypothetical protein
MRDSRGNDVVVDYKTDALIKRSNYASRRFLCERYVMSDIYVCTKKLILPRGCPFVSYTLLTDDITFLQQTRQQKQTVKQDSKTPKAMLTKPPTCPSISNLIFHDLASIVPIPLHNLLHIIYV